MDAIFEDSSEEVGAEIEAHCPSPRCKADTTHTIISMYEDEIRRVQCVVCGEVHAFRKPRGDGPDDAADTVKAAPQKKMTWEDAMARATEPDLGNCRPYSIRDTYELGDVVHHPTFDVGFVVELLPDNKVDVVFRQTGSRILVHNRGDLAARMPDISEIPIPREAKKKKRAKKPDAAEVPLVQRTKSEMDNAMTKARGAAQARVDAAQEAADERNKRLKAEAKATKGAKSGKPAPAVVVPVAPAVKAMPAANMLAKGVPAAKATPATHITKGAPAAKAAPSAKATPAAHITKGAPAAKGAAATHTTKAAPAAKAAKPAAKAGKPVAKAAKPVAKAAKPVAKAAKPVAKAAKPAAKAAKPVAKAAKPAAKAAKPAAKAAKPGKKK